MTDLEAKKSQIEYLCFRVGMPVPTTWTFIDIDPGGTPPTDPPPPGVDDLDTTKKMKLHTIATTERFLAEIRNGHPGS